MDRHIVFCLVLLMAHQSLSQLLPYDCRTTPCVSPTAGDNECDPATPTQCQEVGGTAGVCKAPNSNYDCGSTQPEEVATCTQCDATGVWSCGGSDTGTCLCRAGYYANTATPDCSLARIRASCSQTGINLVVVPYEASFPGNVHTLTNTLANSGTHEYLCTVAADTGSEPPVTIYKVTDYPYTAAGSLNSQTCATPHADTSGANPIYTQTFYVQMAAALQTQTDLEVTVSCEVTTAGTVVNEEFSVQGAAITSVTNFNLVEDTGSGSTLGIYATGTSATNLAGPVGTVPTTGITAGTAIDLRIDMTQGSLYTNVDLVTLEAKNHPSTVTVTAGALTMKIVDNGCVPLTAGTIVDGLTKTHDTTNDIVTIIVKMKAFTIAPYTAPAPTFPVGSVWFTAALCPGTANCARPTTLSPNDDCIDDPQNVNAVGFEDNMKIIFTPTGRRRRQVDEDAEQQTRSLDVVLLVQDPRHISAPTVTTPDIDDEESSCYHSLAFLLPLVLLSVVLLATVVMAMYFCMKLSRRHDNHVEGNTNMAYK